MHFSQQVFGITENFISILEQMFYRNILKYKGVRQGQQVKLFRPESYY
ncbi:hypothetical protein H6F97_22820 [Microcoleus sp. FACHB-1]|nr:hypothetical protein [Microcoleus sp. FACHB-1]